MPDSSHIRAIALPQEERVAAGGRRRTDWGALRFALALVAPATIIVALVVGVPMGYALGLSLTDYYLLDPTHVHFIGLQNYVSLLGDQVFWTSFRNTIVFTFLAVNLEFLLGLGIAALMARSLHGQSIKRSLIMAPMMFAPVLVGFQFKWFFNQNLGLVNNVLTAITGTLHNTAWLVDAPLGFLSILAAEIWMSTPFMVIILLAGLLSVPQEPVEAAEVDGAGPWQRFRYVIFPMIQPYIYVALAVRSLDISRAYDVVRIMTDGGPAHRTELVWTYVTRIVTDQNDLGLGAAMGMVTVVVASAFTVYLFRQLLKARYQR